jgi:hypothetical protein
MKHIIHKSQNIQGSMGWISKTFGKVFGGGGSSGPSEYDLLYLERIKHWEGVMKTFYEEYKQAVTPRLNPPKYGDLDMILSNSFVEVIDQLCEGPIGGICSDRGIILNNAELMRGVYLDGVAVKVSTKYEWKTSPNDVFNEDAVINNPVAFKGVSVAERINTYPKESNFLSISRYMIDHLRNTFTTREPDLSPDRYIGMDDTIRYEFDVYASEAYGAKGRFGVGATYPKAGADGFVYTNSGGYEKLYFYSPWQPWFLGSSYGIREVPREENVMYNVWPLSIIPKYHDRKYAVTLDYDVQNNITYQYQTAKSLSYFVDRTDIYKNEMISSFEEILSLYAAASAITRRSNKYQKIFIDGLMKRRCGNNWDKKNASTLCEQFLNFQNVELGYAGLIMIKAPSQTETQSTIRLNKLSYDPRYADYEQLQRDNFTQWYFENLGDKDLSNLEFHYITNPNPTITFVNKPSLFAKDIPGIRVHSFLVPEIDENGYYVYSPNTYPNMVGFILIEVIDENLFAYRQDTIYDDYEYYLDSFYWDPTFAPQEFISKLDNRYKTEPFLKGRLTHFLGDCVYTNKFKTEINKITALSLIQIET